MTTAIRGLHHVTATAADAQEDLDFYVGFLGLRLVKKTVNFDNHNVYHFYYGNEIGTPSTIMTTFPYRGWGVPVGTKGAGQITHTSFSVPEGSLDFWRKRVGARWAIQEGERFGMELIAFRDPSGLNVELVAANADDRTPWVTADVGEESAIRGLHAVTLVVRDSRSTVAFLTDTLGFRIVNEMEGRTRVGLGEDVPGQVLDIVHAPGAPPAVNGLGTVHHVAMAVDDADTQLRIRADLVQRGHQVTEVRDRQYFRSIYFREPGGVLYEIATVPPGFTVDEEPRFLGTALKLPPWEEPHRAAIEARLPDIVVP